MNGVPVIKYVAKLYILGPAVPKTYDIYSISLVEIFQLRRLNKIIQVY